VDGVVQSIKLITREASERCARFAFSYAQKIGRDRVTTVHKANIMKLSDGTFLSACQEVAKDYPNIKFDDILLDRACLHVGIYCRWGLFLGVRTNIEWNVTCVFVVRLFKTRRNTAIPSWSCRTCMGIF